MINTKKKSLKESLYKNIKIIIYKPYIKLSLIIQYYTDYRRFKKSAFMMRKSQTYENLRARITYFSHSIEKGLSNTNVRLGFGQKALRGLLDSLQLYTTNDNPIDDIRYLDGINVLNKYVEYHKKYDYNVKNLEAELANYHSSVSLSGNAGSLELYKDEIIKRSTLNFSELCKSRISVRDFSEKPVDIDLINKAIEVSMKSPSACNRQPWKVYLIKNQQLQVQILKEQGGLSGFGSNLDTIIAITTSSFYSNGPGERNQVFVDGGMFSMTLIYALQQHGLATCILNAALNQKRDKNVRQHLNLSNDENLILFIAVGNYPEKFKVPVSNRENYKSITKYFH